MSTGTRITRSASTRALRSPGPGLQMSISSASNATTLRSSPVPEPNSKRKLEASESPETSVKRPKNVQSAYRKHPQFWALDGNVLIQLDATRFKLHRSRLAVQSPWFDTLFQRKASAIADLDGCETGILRVLGTAKEIDNCDYFCLDSMGVAEKDFACLLTAMNDAIDFYHDEPNFPTVASIYRVAFALRFPKFLKFAKGYIEEDFKDSPKCVTNKEHEFAIEAVLLGRNWPLPTILKRAFYDLTRKAPEDDVGMSSDEREGAEVPDAADEAEEVGHRDSDHSADDGDSNDANANRSHNNLLRLDPVDLVRLLTAQKQLTASWHDVLSFRQKKCPSKKDGCQINSSRVHGNIIYQADLIKNYQYDPICGIKQLFKVDWKDKGYCEMCAAGVVSHLMDCEKRIWDNLEDWFYL